MKMTVLTARVSMWRKIVALPFAVFLGAGLGCLGCSKSTPPVVAAPTQTATDPAFDAKWSQLASLGIETAYIENDRGQGLMGNVRRASGAELRPDPGTLMPAKADPNAVVPERPEGEDIQKVIRENLSAVKSCYMSMARAGINRSGKAIVSFDIGADGKPAAVKIEAPSFDGTSLPNCVGNQVARWAFPRSQKGGGIVSYPFVFVGG